MKIKLFIALCVSLLWLTPLKSFGEIDELVRYSYAKDGGTRCLKVISSNEEIRYCIDHKQRIGPDHRVIPGTGDVYVVRNVGLSVLRKKEVKELHGDIVKFMQTVKYKSFDENEYKRASTSDRNRYYKLQAYHELESFRAEIETKIK